MAARFPGHQAGSGLSLYCSCPAVWQVQRVQKGHKNPVQKAMFLTNSIQILDIPVPDKGYTETTLDAVPGLRVRVTAAGGRAFVFRYKVADKAHTVTIGRCSHMSIQEATQKALECRALLTLGRNPAEEMQATKRELRTRISRQDELNPKLKHAAEQYLEVYAKPRKKPKTYRADVYHLTTFILPALGGMRIQDIQRRDVVTVLNPLFMRGVDMTANHVRATMSGLFSWCIRQGLLENNPVTYAERAATRSRERVLADSEIRALWADDKPTAPVLALRMVLASGQRPGEVAGMCWADLHEEAGGTVWRMADTKNGRAQAVPLSSLMADILAATPRQGEHVFMTRRGHTAGRVAMGRAMGALFGTNNPTGRRGNNPTAHDLRRTAITRISMLGFARTVQNAIANHVDHSVGGIYDRNDYLKEKRQALEALAAELRGVTGAGAVNLVDRSSENAQL